MIKRMFGSLTAFLFVLALITTLAPPAHADYSSTWYAVESSWQAAASANWCYYYNVNYTACFYGTQAQAMVEQANATWTTAEAGWDLSCREFGDLDACYNAALAPYLMADFSYPIYTW